MIVYNIGRAWFTEKAEAEARRKLRGLKPHATLKVEVKHRADLAALLNALCEPQQALAAVSPLPEPIVPQAVIDEAYVDPGIDVPDYIPRFLLDDAGKKRWDERHRVTWDEQQGMLR